MKPGIVPSIFPNYPSYLQTKNEKPRKSRQDQPRFSAKADISINKCGTRENAGLLLTENTASSEIKSQVNDIGIQVDIPKIDSTSHQKVINGRLRSTIYRLQKKLAEKEKELQNIQKKLDDNPEYNKIFTIKEAAKERNQKAVYLLDQINNFGKVKVEWSEQTIRYCVAWRIASPKGYEYGRSSQLIAAPSRSTLDRYMGNVDCDVGISQLVKDRLKAECENLQSTEKIVSMIANEMAIKERLLYNKASDKFIGIVNTEGIYDSKIGKYPTLANKLLCFVVHGLSKKFTIPAAYFFVKSLQGSDLFLLVQRVIKAVEETGFLVLRVVTNNHRTNLSMFKHFGGGELKTFVPHPCDPERKLYLSFDYCHLIKNVRSQFLDREMTDGNGIISSKYLKEIYRLQKDLTIKPIRYLTKNLTLKSH